MVGMMVLMILRGMVMMVRVQMMVNMGSMMVVLMRVNRAG